MASGHVRQLSLSMYIHIYIYIYLYMYIYTYIYIRIWVHRPCGVIDGDQLRPRLFDELFACSQCSAGWFFNSLNRCWLVEISLISLAMSLWFLLVIYRTRFHGITQHLVCAATKKSTPDETKP